MGRIPVPGLPPHRTFHFSFVPCLAHLCPVHPLTLLRVNRYTQSSLFFIHSFRLLILLVHSFARSTIDNISYSSSRPRSLRLLTRLGLFHTFPTSPHHPFTHSPPFVICSYVLVFKPFVISFISSCLDHFPGVCLPSGQPPFLSSVHPLTIHF